MKIEKILINHMLEPVGFKLNDLRIEFTVLASKFEKATKQLIIWKENSEVPFYETDFLPFDNNYFDVKQTLDPRTKYLVQVNLKTSTETISKKTFFETGKMNEPFSAHWIVNSNKNLQNTLFKKDLNLSKTVAKARLYITGLGLYEAYLDNQKIGDEYLTPGATNYDQLVQVQTYDLTQELTDQTTHQLLISTGDGWYKGRYGFDGGKDKIYGDQQMVLAELHLEYSDGSTEVINTDDSWQTASGQITKSAIYYGEDLDDTLSIQTWEKVAVLNKTTEILDDRQSLPIKVQEKLPVKKIITTPKNELVLDFGQNHAGWIEFFCDEPKGTKLTFQMGEILQQGNFYRDNLREARAAFTYISDGTAKWVRPHFTYFGFRYVKVTGNTKPIKAENIHSCVLYSTMATTGAIKTENQKVNRLFENILWSQKSNFFDVPTDCPQRDERLGWTGDANIFSNTAAFNMNVYQFFKKYSQDMLLEQKTHNGMLTMYAPSMHVDDGGAAVWGDAATFIPWNMYQNYGDPAIIKQNYSAMKSWVDWVTSQTTTKNFWTGTFQFGDWIALDGENPALPTGKTDEDYIGSVYYYYSTKIVAKAAKVLGQTADYEKYSAKAQDIKRAIQSEYITDTGRLAIDTQTAYALALYFELIPTDQIKRVVDDLIKRLKKDNYHLKTGFVGTPFICQVLSKYGHHDLASKIFMFEDFPSWLYAVNMGATTVWERWNSVEEDGSMNPEGMNSLNHYSIGAIMEWAYKYVLGISDHSVGYQTVNFQPHFDYHLKHIQGHFDSPYGKLAIKYDLETNEQHQIKLQLQVPFGMTVNVDLPRTKTVTVNGETKDNGLSLTAGTYELAYTPDEDYIGKYDPQTTVKEIMQDKQLVDKISQIDPVLNMFVDNDDAVNGGLGTMTVTALNSILPSINITSENLFAINEVLKTTPLLSERK